MASVVKQIKPSKLKQDTFRLEILNVLHEAQRGMMKDFKATVETWEHKVEFQSMITTVPNPEVMVWTDDEIYGYVNNGTPAHVIPAKNVESLSFNWDGYGSYGPKTAPGVLGSVNAVYPTTPVKFRAVNHPGIEARHFDQDIQKKWLPRFKVMCELALRIAAQKSGHSMSSIAGGRYAQIATL